MKSYTPVSLLSVFVLGLSALFFGLSREAATKQESSDESFTVNLHASLPKGARLVEFKDGDPPSWMRFLLDSDYVVIATGVQGAIIGKRGIDRINADASERMIGTVYPLKIERVLFSRKAFEGGVELTSAPYPYLQVYSKNGTSDNVVLDGTRYLLFLKAIPKDNEIFTTLELEKDRTYYQTFLGNQSLFPSGASDMHGPNKRGKIDLTGQRHAKLVTSIQALYQALNPGDNKERIRRLQKLRDSRDENLRLNAEYAIKYLSQRGVE